ncbi:MAG: LCP family protein [Saccharofermentans sp.]|nr:LCP family protein [Saccharofermentans sp.]
MNKDKRNLSIRNTDTAVYKDSDFTDLSAQKTSYKGRSSKSSAASSGNKKSAGKVKKGFNKKKHIKFRVVFGVLAALLGVIAGVVCFAFWYKEYLLNKITYETKAPDASITIVNEKGETVLLNEVTQTTRFEYIQDEPIKNYLLIGIDSRSSYYNESGTGERSDVICVMSVDKKAGTIKLISVARDSYALFPGYENFYKINASMSWGGPDLLVETVESCLRINIDGYAYVNFSHMADIVDAVGGVYVDMTPGEVSVANDYIESMNPYAERIYNYGEDTWLNGIQAVAYARIRYVGNGDFERMERQIEVLRSILDQYMRLSATDKLAAMDDVLEAIVTDIDKNEIQKMAFEFLPSVKNLEMQYLQLPIEGCYNCGIYGDEWSERINWNAMVPYVQQFLYGRTMEFDEVPIPRYAPDLEDCDTDIPLEDLVH